MSSQTKPQLIIVVGPTASGKTELGIQLAKETGGSVVSADSRQVYARMNIGTATPLEAALPPKARRLQPPGGDLLLTGREPHDILIPDIIESVPHFLLNISSPDKSIALADWQKAALAAIDHIIAEGRTPLLVGGTMLYIDSIVYQYDIPQVKPDDELRSRLEKENPEELYQRLVSQDPGASEFIEPHNKRRIIRALEVIEATGKPFSLYRSSRPSHYKIEMIGLFPGWERLEQRINQRVAAMLAEGLLEETERLRAKYSPELALLQTLNYKQAVAVLEGRLSHGEAVAEMIRANMRLARRQMAWWKGRQDITWYTMPKAAYT